LHFKILLVSLPANNDLVPGKLHCPKINNEIFARDDSSEKMLRAQVLLYYFYGIQRIPASIR
jgi:hypothetical protein